MDFDNQTVLVMGKGGRQRLANLGGHAVEALRNYLRGVAQKRKSTGCKAVSYTHLDGYKRQGIFCGIWAS